MAKFTGKISLDIRDSEPDWEPYLAPKAPEGAPNVLFIAWDDVGYGTMDVFGGPVETPTMRRIADMGVRYANFHTTALCSPTRASLLTGRNATSNGMATIAEFSAGFPGISTRIPFENGFISEVLAERGYNTYCVGKWHLTPGEETGMAAFKGRWPLGRGFERFYGYLGGESSSWYPDLIHDNHPVDPPATPDEGYHLSKDLSDKAIEFIRDAKVVDPDKPFFMYLAPQAGHAPHHVFAEWADRYKGRFDEGYEALRETILARQVELGLLPGDTQLSPINPHGEPATTGPDGQPWPLLDTVRPWDSLSEDEQRLFARMAEVFAGYISYADDQLGRVIDFLESSGELENTLIVVISDNGASGEGGPNGSFNEWRFFNGVPDTTAQTLPHIDELGSPASYNHYNTGWAWAFDTPFPYWKRWAGYEGGVSDMCLVSWPAKIPAQARGAPAVRARRGRGADRVRPAGHHAARRHQGVPAEPDRGRELRRLAHRPRRGGQADAVLRDARPALDLPRRLARLHACTRRWAAGAGSRRTSGSSTTWSTTAPSRPTWPSKEPVRLESLKSLWFYYAGIYNGLPLDDRSAIEQVLAERPHGTPPRDRFIYYPDCASVPEQSGVVISGRSYTIAAGVAVESADAEGVLYAHGGIAGGHSLYVKDRRLHYAFNWVGTHLQTVSADRELTPGAHVLTAEFTATGRNPDPAMPGAAGTLTLYIDDQAVGSGEIVTQPGYFCVVGDGICVGRDDASPVTPDYVAPFRFTGGTIDKVIVDVSGERYVDHEAQVRAWFSID